jgi:hypothetical protein
VGRVDHAKQDSERNPLDVVRVLDAVDALAPHLIKFHDRVGRVEPSVTDETGAALQGWNGLLP